MLSRIINVIKDTKCFQKQIIRRGPGTHLWAGILPKAFENFLARIKKFSLGFK